MTSSQPAGTAWLGGNQSPDPLELPSMSSDVAHCSGGPQRSLSLTHTAQLPPASPRHHLFPALPASRSSRNTVSVPDPRVSCHRVAGVSHRGRGVCRDPSQEINACPALHDLFAAQPNIPSSLCPSTSTSSTSTFTSTLSERLRRLCCVLSLPVLCLGPLQCTVRLQLVPLSSAT